MKRAVPSLFLCRIAGTSLFPQRSDLPNLAGRDFPYIKDRMLTMGDMDIHQNNVEAIWDRIGGK